MHSRTNIIFPTSLTIPTVKRSSHLHEILSFMSFPDIHFLLITPSAFLPSSFSSFPAVFSMQKPHVLTAVFFLSISLNLQIQLPPSQIKPLHLDLPSTQTHSVTHIFTFNITCRLNVFPQSHILTKSSRFLTHAFRCSVLHYSLAWHYSINKVLIISYLHS